MDHDHVADRRARRLRCEHVGAQRDRFAVVGLEAVEDGAHRGRLAEAAADLLLGHERLAVPERQLRVDGRAVEAPRDPGDVALDPRQRRRDLQRHVRSRPDEPGALDGVADVGGGAELLRRRAERHLSERERHGPGEEVLDHGRRGSRREPTDEELAADGDTCGDRGRPRDGRRRRRGRGRRRRGRRRRGRRSRRRRAGRRPLLRVRGRRPDEQSGGEHAGDETPCEQDK